MKITLLCALFVIVIVLISIESKRNNKRNNSLKKKLGNEVSKSAYKKFKKQRKSFGEKPVKKKKKSYKNAKSKYKRGKLSKNRKKNPGTKASIKRKQKSKSGKNRKRKPLSRSRQKNKRGKRIKARKPLSRRQRNKNKKSKHRRQSSRSKRKYKNGTRNKHNKLSSQRKKNNRKWKNQKARNIRKNGKKKQSKGEINAKITDLMKQQKGARETAFIIEEVPHQIRHGGHQYSRLNMGNCYSTTRKCAAIKEIRCLTGVDERFFTVNGNRCLNWLDAGFQSKLEGSNQTDVNHSRCVDVQKDDMIGPRCYVDVDSDPEPCYFHCACFNAPTEVFVINYTGASEQKIYEYVPLMTNWKTMTLKNTECFMWYNEGGSKVNRVAPPKTDVWRGCSNPDLYNGGPWCYTDSDGTWEVCYPRCKLPRKRTISTIELNSNVYGPRNAPYNVHLGSLGPLYCYAGQIVVIESSIFPLLRITIETSGWNRTMSFVYISYGGGYEITNSKQDGYYSKPHLVNEKQYRGIVIYAVCLELSLTVYLGKRKRETPEGYYKNTYFSELIQNRIPDNLGDPVIVTIDGSHADTFLRRYKSPSISDVLIPYTDQINTYPNANQQSRFLLFILYVKGGDDGNFNIELNDGRGFRYRCRVLFQYQLFIVESNQAGAWANEKHADQFPFGRDAAVYELKLELQKSSVIAYSNKTVMAEIDSPETRKFQTFTIKAGAGARPDPVVVLSVVQNPTYL